jgi:glycosyltransferase involved in cell wall biosynthesis
MTSDYTYDQRMLRISKVMDEYGDVTIYHTGKIGINTFFRKGILFYLEYNLRLLWKLLFNKFDIVYAVDTDTLLAAGVASWFKKFFFIYDSHEYFIGVPELKDKMIKKFIWKSVENWFVKRTNLCITVNGSLATILSNEFKKEFLAVQNVPFLSQNETKNKQKDNYFIYQGAVNEGRGLEELIAVMKELPKYKLLIIGDGDIKKQLEEKASIEKTENVLFLGKKTPTELIPLTANALLGFNLLSENSQSYYYSSANKCYDYINGLIPSINMAFPEYLGILEKYPIGECIRDLDIKTITFAIEKILDPSRYDSYLIACKKAREEYNWERESKKLRGVLISHLK